MPDTVHDLDPRQLAAPTLSRRTALSTLAAGAAALALPARGETPARGEASAPACRDPKLVPNVVVMTHEGRRAWLHDDLLAGKAVLLHFTSSEAERSYPVLENLAKVQDLLAERLGKDALLLTVSTDPDAASPHALRELAARHGAGPGWLFVSAEPRDLEVLKGRFFEHASEDASGHHDAAASTASEDCSRGLMRYGNPSLGLWGSVPAKADPAWIAERLAWVSRKPVPTGPPRRRGPVAVAALLLALGAGAAAGQGAPPTCPAPSPPQGLPCAGKGHPYPQPQMTGQSQKTIGDTTTVTTGTSLFPQSYPFVDPPGTNLLPTIYTNLFDSNCKEIPNTLPSTPTVPYNLHDGEPVVTAIDRTSPTNDLERILDQVERVAADRGRTPFDEAGAVVAMKMAVDILEGNPVPNRAYSGFPLLHYNGPNKYQTVTPTYDQKGNVTGGNVDIHQIWYDNHIEADTSFVDPTLVAEVPWTITYTLDVLDRGEDDFSPYVMYYDAPSEPFVPGHFGAPNAGMDQTFFPIEEGTRTVLKLKMAPAKYFSLSYTWGWRWHPPRVQVTENATKCVGSMTTLQWEQSVFGDDPEKNEDTKRAAIDKIGDLAPAKRMWRSLRTALADAADGHWHRVGHHAGEARLAFEDWQDRTRLPRGVELDPTADMTLFYVNNTLYGQLRDGGTINFPAFQSRGAQYSVALVNGDYFNHAYMNVDFGGGRGWENQFKSSVKVAGSGCWFTFGRNYFAMNLSPMVTIAAATQQAGQADTLGRQRVEIQFNFDPARRLRFYQFDPTHHDVAVYSIH